MIINEYSSYLSVVLYVPPDGSYCIHQLSNINVLSDHANKDTAPFCLKLGACGERW